MNDTIKGADERAIRESFESTWLAKSWTRRGTLDHEGDFIYDEDWVQGAYCAFAHFSRASLGAAQVPAPTKDEIQAAFETWMERVCPSGDVTEVQHQWEASNDYEELFQPQSVSAGAAQVPALWVSPEQAAAHADADHPEAGRYLPCRRTPAGKFTMPLYAHPAGAAQVPSLSEKDRHEGEIAVLEAAIASNAGHLGALIDDLRGMMAKALKTMTALHNVATPDEDTPDLDARIPADDFRKFVDAHAELLYSFAPHKEAAAAGSQPSQQGTKS